MEGATGWQRSGGLRCLWGGYGGSDGGREDIARQDWGADAGERFFVRCARQGGAAERKTMIDRGHALPLVRQGGGVRVGRGSGGYKPPPAPGGAGGGAAGGVGGR